MTEKELRKLNRYELLEMLLAQGKSWSGLNANWPRQMRGWRSGSRSLRPPAQWPRQQCV